jgi:hypothetical protein
MRTNTRTSWIAFGCLLLGLGGGAATAQVVGDALSVRNLNSGLFSLDGTDTAAFHVTLDEARGASGGRVLMQFLDEWGTVVARKDVTLQAGQSASLRTEGPGLFRAHAQLVDAGLQITSRRAVVGAVEVLDLTTEQRGPVCSFDEWGLPGGRQ